MDDICSVGDGNAVSALPPTELLLMDCPSAMLLVDHPTGAILDANPSAEVVYGVPVRQLRTMTLADLRSPLVAESREGNGGDGGWSEYHRVAGGRSRMVSLAAASTVVGGRTLRLLLVREVEDLVSRLERLDREIERVVREGPAWQALAIAVEPLLADTCDADCAWLAVVGPDGRLLAGHRPEGKLHADDMAEGIAEDPVTFGHDPIALACRVGKALRLEERQGERRSQGVTSTLVVPLGAFDDVAATLCVQTSAVGAFDDAYQAWLNPVARRLALAVQLLQAMQRTRLQDAALASTANGIFITDADGLIEWANGGLAAITGYRNDDMLGHTPSIFRSGQQDARFYEHLWSTIRSGSPWDGEVVNRRKDGRLITVKQNITPVIGDDGAISHFVAVHQDITAQRDAEARSAFLTAHDQLTGLPNRALLRDRLHQAMLMADRCNRRVSLIHLDLDRFGDINAAYGHKAGDRLLTATAGRLRETLRRSDTVARIGADEFAILLPELRRSDDVQQVAEKVANEIKAMAGTDDLPPSLSCCIGTAVYPGDAGDVDQFLMAAALALGAARSNGRGSVMHYCRSMSDRLTARIDMQHDLAQALARQELSLAYQPQVALANGSVIGVEALLRWQSPSRGHVSPAAFIPVAEDSGLIVDIGRWVIDEACRQIAHWRDQGLSPVRVAVNISPVQLSHGGLARCVADSLARWDVPPSALEFELTESVLLTRSPEIVTELEVLRHMGVTWAIDDFGTGYASMDYVRRFPVDRLKIDRSFVDGLLNSASDGAIVRSIVGLGQSLGLFVVAEGVETPDQIEALRRLGCNAIQGYVFSRPLPPEQVPDKLAEIMPNPAT